MDVNNNIPDMRAIPNCREFIGEYKIINKYMVVAVPVLELCFPCLFTIASILMYQNIRMY